MKLFRFTCDGLGIYEAVERDCSKKDPRRNQKPDGSWLKKIGSHYPGAISYWTQKGLQTYIDSGLMAWHQKVTQGKKEISIASLTHDCLYQDDHQVIANASCFNEMLKFGIGNKKGPFVSKRALEIN